MASRAAEVVAWGMNIVPEELSEVVAIAASGANSLALRAEGTVVGWEGGWSLNWPEMAVPEGLTEVVAIAAGSDHRLALLANGTVTAWGLNELWWSGEWSSAAATLAAKSGTTPLIVRLTAPSFQAMSNS